MPGDLRGYTDFEQDGLGGGAGRLGAVLLSLVQLALVLAAGVGLSFLRQLGPSRLVPPLALCVGLLAGLLAVLSYRTFRLSSSLLRALLLVGFAAAPSAAYWCALPPSLHESTRTLPLLGQTLPVTDTLHAGTVLLIALGAFTAGCTVFRRRFLCETCERWGRGCRVISPLYLCVPEATACSLLAGGHISPLLSASPVPAAASQTALTAVVRYCTTCRRGALWVYRTVSGGRRRLVPCLGHIPLDAEAVRSLLEIAS